MFANDEDICPECETPLVLDHTGPNGYEYWACPKCDVQPSDDSQRCAWHPDGENRCSNPSVAGLYCRRCALLHDRIEPIKLTNSVVEHQSDQDIAMRDCAFLWSIGIRADEDMLRCLVLTRKLLELQEDDNAIQK